MIEQGLYQALAANVGITAIVGTNVFPYWRKDLPIPSVLFSGVAGSGVTSMSGEDTLRFKRIQFDCYAPAAGYYLTRQLSDLVRALLVPLSSANGYPYQLPDGTEIQSADVKTDLDMQAEQGSGGFVARAILEIEFVYIPA